LKFGPVDQVGQLEIVPEEFVGKISEGSSKNPDVEAQA